jgi:hypothetical protein
MTEYTPGPWQQSGDVIWSQEHGVVCQLSTVHPPGCLIEHRRLECGSDDWNEAMANANLITAAPNLLAACEALVEWDEKATSRSIETVTDMARAAIAKVRGGQ